VAKGKTGIAAYLAAGYQASRDAANVSASRLLSRPEVKARVDELAARSHGRIAVQQITEAVRNGRPTLYREEMGVLAKDLALLGLTDEQIAHALQIVPPLLYDWKRAHPKFRDAINEGREIADARVARSLYERAIGYTHEAEKIFHHVDVGVVRAKYIENYPPDTQAASLWLRNRQPDRWRDKRDVGIEGSFAHRFSQMSEAERIADARALAEQIRRALLENAQTIDGEAEEVVEPPPRNVAEQPPRR
jgi:hypothetical protein